MPRKTDGIEFELHPSPQKDKDGKPLLYVKLASKKKLTFAQLESYSISHKHMAKGELEACFTKFLNCAALWFHEGYRVETPIGSFAPKLKLTGEHTDPKTVTGRDIRYDGSSSSPPRTLSERSAPTGWVSAASRDLQATARCTIPRQWTRPCAAVSNKASPPSRYSESAAV